MQPLPYALFGVITDGAGIHKDDISLFKGGDRIKSLAGHDRGNDLAVREIHLTTIGFDIYFFIFSHEGYYLLNPKTIKGILLRGAKVGIICLLDFNKFILLLLYPDSEIQKKESQCQRI